jgi:hypothetical protein
MTDGGRMNYRRALIAFNRHLRIMDTFAQSIGRAANAICGARGTI